MSLNDDELRAADKLARWLVGSMKRKKEKRENHEFIEYKKDFKTWCIHKKNRMKRQ